MPSNLIGLTSAAARSLLESAGPDAVSDVAAPGASREAQAMGAAPWMLEAAIALQIGTGEYA
jgi:hypothetical protein